MPTRRQFIKSLGAFGASAVIMRSDNAAARLFRGGGQAAAQGGGGGPTLVGWSKRFSVGLPAAANSISNAVVGVRISDASAVANLNSQGEGNALKFTKADGTAIPHQVIRADWPAAVDGVWSWYTPKPCVYSNGYTYYGFVTTFGEVCVGWYKLSDGTKGSVVLKVVTTGAEGGIDDHNNPSLIVLASGKVLAAYADHSGPVLECRRQTTVGDPTTWDSAVALGSTGNTAEIDLVQLSGTGGSDGGDIYAFFRVDNNARNYCKSTNAGGTWGAITPLFQSPDNAHRGTTEGIRRPYLLSNGNPAGTKIHFCITDAHPYFCVDPAATSVLVNSIYHGYFDTSTGNVHKSDGTVMSGGTFASPPAGGFDTANLTRVFDGYTDRLPYWNWSIECDPVTGNPSMAIIKFNGAITANVDYIIAQWNGTSWDKINITSQLGLGKSTAITGSFEPGYHGGVRFKPSDPRGTAYISYNDSVSGLWSVWRIKSADGGATWALDQKLSTMRGNERKAVRPMPVVGYNGSGPEVFWCEGHYLWWGTQFGGSMPYSAQTFATSIQSYPRTTDGYVAWLKLDRDTSPQTIYGFFNNGSATDQSVPATVFSGWFDYGRDIHANIWDTGRLVAMEGASEFSSVFIGYWDRATFNNSQQAHMASNYVSTPRGMMMREQSAAGSNETHIFVDSAGGTIGDVAWSSNIVPQSWNTLFATWKSSTDAGNILPYKNGTALTPVTGSTNALYGSASTGTLRYGHSPHLNSKNFWNGRIGWVGFCATKLSADFVREFSLSNPFNEAWNYASLGSITNV